MEWLTLVNDPAHPEGVAVHFDHLQALLAGYEQVRPLSAAEAAALAPMTALCHAEFALSETDYFLERPEFGGESADGGRRLAGGSCAMVPQRGGTEIAGRVASMGG